MRILHAISGLLNTPLPVTETTPSPVILEQLRSTSVEMICAAYESAFIVVAQLIAGRDGALPPVHVRLFFVRAMGAASFARIAPAVFRRRFTRRW